MKIRKDIIIAASVVLLLSSAFASTPMEEALLFKSGSDGYRTYRIPALITTRTGTVLAFCEGRKFGRSDSGDIDMLVKRSEDGGATWSDQIVVWDDKGNTCGNPCPVVDRSTGRIILLMTWNRGADEGRDLHRGTAQGTRRVFQSHSDDDGVTWSTPVEITGQAKDPSWWWYATGPGIGIQLEREPNRGRLVIPANHTADHYFGAHTIYSDDGGETWKRSNVIKPTCNESQVVELADARLMMNMRSQGFDGTSRLRNGYRSISFSKDGGATWSDPEFDDELGDPVCQASILRYDEDRILFSSPSPPISPKRGERIRMAIRLSRDDGETWSVPFLVHEGKASYSCLTRLPDGTVGLLYEKDRDIALARIPWENIHATAATRSGAQVNG